MGFSLGLTHLLAGYASFSLSRTVLQLETLLSVRAYRRKRHTVLTVGSLPLLAELAHRAVLSPINSGATRPYPQPRGRDTFMPLSDYPFDDWNRKRHGHDPAVELALIRSVPDIREFLIRVENRGGGKLIERVWARS